MEVYFFVCTYQLVHNTLFTAIGTTWTSLRIFCSSSFIAHTTDDIFLYLATLHLWAPIVLQTLKTTLVTNLAQILVNVLDVVSWWLLVQSEMQEHKLSQLPIKKPLQNSHNTNLESVFLHIQFHDPISIIEIIEDTSLTGI